VIGEDEIETAGEADRLLAAARALMARGEDQFTVARVCAEAGLGRDAFRRHFPGREALIGALTRAAAPAAADMWLERRLRVFERALGALEARAEQTAREQALTIARLQERLARVTEEAAELIPPEPPIQSSALPPAVPAAAPEPATPPARQLAPLPDPLPPPVVLPVARASTSETLEQGRRAARLAARPPSRRKSRRRRQLVLLRRLTILALVMLAALLGVAVMLGNPAAAIQAAGGVRHRDATPAGIRRITALADSGDAVAQTALAFAYLRGEGVARDTAAAARWSAAAAEQGEVVAQALAGTLALDGESREAARAPGWLAAAAAAGNVKAMHNLAIAYARGRGVAADPARAAAWFLRAAGYGYVDSAFDLAVLYERGMGVPQNLRDALMWYSIAARAGDGPAAARAATLRQQLDPGMVAEAAAAAARFSPRTPPARANRLPPL
jgi:TPR repeat protein